MDTFDFVVIGAGPARRSRREQGPRAGASVAIIDRRWFGGSCPFIGCLPSKALLHGAAEHHANPAAYPWPRASAHRDYMVNRDARRRRARRRRSTSSSLERAGATVSPRRGADRRPRPVRVRHDEPTTT